MNSEKSRLKSFIQKRNELIMGLENLEYEKEEFLEKNLKIITSHQMSPFLEINSLEEGLYNYHYYNSLAKKYCQLARNSRLDKRGQKKRKEDENKRNNYYSEKDKVISKILDLVEAHQLKAYFVKCYSKRLSGNLIEIVVEDVDYAVFHSLSPEIQKKLEDKGCFVYREYESIIDSYINNQKLKNNRL